VQKQGLTLQANICGVTVDTYYSFDKIFGFALILKDSTQAYASNMALQISYEQYKKFLKDVEKVKSVYPDYSEEELARMKGQVGQALVKKMTTK
jgi:hypothetical protein